jgi:DNA-binding NtrC family response regulator
MALEGNHHVVVADGDVAARGVLEHQLRGWDCLVVGLHSHAQLLDHLWRATPDLLLLDSGFDGHDSLELLPNLLQEFNGLVVVLLAARGSIDDAVRAIKVGACDYLTKPPDLERLRVILNQRCQTAFTPSSAEVRTIDQLERQAILEALRKTRGKVREAAKLLGFGQATVYRKIKRYHIELEALQLAAYDRAPK